MEFSVGIHDTKIHTNTLQIISAYCKNIIVMLKFDKDLPKHFGDEHR